MKVNLINKDIICDPLKRSMILSTICKPAGMLISFLYTPVLLGYLGDESYGIWSTILSIINWINYFDVGIGNGLRNMLTKYIESDDVDEANHAVSTGYIALAAISMAVFIIGTIFIAGADIHLIFNTNINVKPALFVSFACICINFVLTLSKVQLYAIHQAEKVSFMALFTQLLNLLGIKLISLFSHGSLLGVAVIIGLSGIIINLWFSNGVWRKYKYLIPKVIAFEKGKLRDICNVGIKFFIIQIAALILYSTDNIIITQLFGPSYVTPYHTSYSAFGIVNGLFAAMIAPLWSKYTIALENKDYKWMKRTILNLDKMLIVIGAVLLIGVFAFEPLSIIWLRKEVNYQSGLIPCMGIYYFIMIWGSIYATALNGMGRLNLQLILSIITAVMNIPLSILFGKVFELETTGVLLATIICMVIVEFALTLDAHRYLNKFIYLNRR